jgi:hypothetical protein
VRWVLWLGRDYVAGFLNVFFNKFDFFVRSLEYGDTIFFKLLGQLFNFSASSAAVRKYDGIPCQSSIRMYSTRDNFNTSGTFASLIA